MSLTLYALVSSLSKGLAMLSATNIHKVYPGRTKQSNDVHVLRGITIEVAKGDVMAIIGPSGAGKSTLLHVLGGLDKPTQGEVIFDQKNIYTLSDGDRAKIRNQRVGFIFQFYHLLPEFSALENVILPALVKADSRLTASMKIVGQDLLDRVGLADRAGHKPNELSGGEQQRVAIARALVNEPDILFCDEPTGNLDSANGAQVIDLLMKLNKENQQTLVIVTHDEHIAARVNKIIHLKDGEILQER